MKHRRAVILMILTTFLWSISGVITRHLDAERGFEVAFWRSLFNGLALSAGLSVLRGRVFWRDVRRAQWPIWVSGVCWSIMFSAYMVALTMISVANLLVAMSIGPLLTALFSRLVLGYHLPLRTWLAIALAGVGIVWMFGKEAMSGVSSAGMLIALMVPLAAATNWTTMQFVAQRQRRAASATVGTSLPEAGTDMLPAVLIGTLLSALLMFPAAYPLQASAHDVGILGFLGVFNLAIPCFMVVRLSRELPAAEIALLGLLEVIFGITWAWLWAGEQPSVSTLTGGVLVIGALLANELLGLRKR